jgi:hypothetical protein
MEPRREPPPRTERDVITNPRRTHMPAKKKLAVAVTAMFIAAGSGGIAAAGAQAQNEVLQATTTAFLGGGTGSCLSGSASATFSATGPATGPYSGTFTETNANVNVSAQIKPHISKKLTLSIPFVITSGTTTGSTTTITGTITNPPPYAGGSILCGSGSFPAAGVIVTADGATYTATIQSQGRAQTVTGIAQVSAAFQFRPRYVLGAPPTATLLNFPSP